MNQRLRFFVSLGILSVFSFSPIGISTSAPAQGNTVITNEQIPFEDTQWVECFLEPIHIKALIHSVYRVTTDNKGRTHIGEHFNFHHFEAVGTVSGIKYEGQQTYNYELNTDQPLPTEFTIIMTLTGESQGSLDNLTIKWRVHITVNSNGEVTSNFEVDQVICRG